MKKHLLILATALLSISTFSQIPNYVPANGLVGWWPFNGNANDESGNGNHGTVNGATLTQDRFGNANMAYGFDGVDDYIRIIDDSTLLNSVFSVSIWFKTNILFDPSHTIIIAKDNISPLWQMTINGPNFGNLNGTIMPQYFNGQQATTQFNQNINVINDLWHFGVLICNQNTGILELYLDNNHIVSLGISNSTPIPSDILIGIGVSLNNRQFNGKIDDVGYWSRALTACEIQDLYQSQVNYVSQAVSAGADQSICSGDPVTLNGSGGSSYQWNNNVVDGQAFTPNQSANYVLNGTDSLGCQGTDTVVVTVLENATSTLTQTALDSYTLNGQTYTQSGTYTQTLTAANGCDSTITLNLTLNFTGIDELGTNAKKLVNITDLNGKTIPRRKNTLMLFIYEDGTVERVVEMEE
jgi:hypothetical protein